MVAIWAVFRRMNAAWTWAFSRLMVLVGEIGLDPVELLPIAVDDTLGGLDGGLQHRVLLLDVSGDARVFSTWFAWAWASLPCV